MNYHHIFIQFNSKDGDFNGKTKNKLLKKRVNEKPNSF